MAKSSRPEDLEQLIGKRAPESAQSSAPLANKGGFGGTSFGRF
jgi:hypothetical protein